MVTVCTFTDEAEQLLISSKDAKKFFIFYSMNLHVLYVTQYCKNDGVQVVKSSTSKSSESCNYYFSLIFHFFNFPLIRSCKPKGATENLCVLASYGLQQHFEEIVFLRQLKKEKKQDH